MKKGFVIALALALLLSAGCSIQTEQPAPTAASTAPETTTVPETTAPETEPTLPKLETGTVQGGNIPAQKPQEDTGSSGGGGGSWTPPAL